jgi:hypothetical protein
VAETGYEPRETLAARRASHARALGPLEGVAKSQFSMHGSSFQKSNASSLTFPKRATVWRGGLGGRLLAICSRDHASFKITFCAIALRAKTFQLSQLPLKARALSQMPALGAGPSKRKWYKISTFEIVDLAEMFWVAVY